MLVALTCPAHNDRTPRYMEKALAAMHQGLHTGEQIVLSYGVLNEEVTLLVQLHEALAGRTVGPILANYPQATNAVVDPTKNRVGDRRWTLNLRLTPQLFPILRHAQFEDQLGRRYADPIDSLLRALMPGGDVQCRVDFVVSPADSRRVKRAKRAVSLLDRTFFRARSRWAAWYADHVCTPRRRWTVAMVEWMARHSTKSERSAPLDVSANRTHEREADLQSAADKLGGHLFDVRLSITASAPVDAGERAAVRLHAIAATLGAITRSRLATFTTAEEPEPFLMSPEELATLWHPPIVGGGAERVAYTAFTEHEPPAALPAYPELGDTIFGHTCFRGDDRPVILRAEDRRRHVYLVGKTGMGKTTLLLNQLRHDISTGRGVCLIDPHGDLAEATLNVIPPERTNDVILFDAGDSEQAVAFNPLHCPDALRADQVASSVVASLRKMYESWGPRLEDTLRNALYAAIEQGGTFLTVLRLLSDAAFRERVVASLHEPIVRSFWMHEFTTWSRAYRTEAVAAIQNKIRPFLTHKTMRAIVSQATRSLDLRAVMDSGKVLIVNLSKGRIGEDNAGILGSLLVTSLQQAAMGRADMPESERRDFYLYVDEFQNFATGAFATILSEARKYGLSLTISHQYFRQLDEPTAHAVLGNVGTVVSFAVGSDDAEWLATAMNKSPGQLSAHDLTNLPKYTACVRLLMDGSPSPPFTIRTLSPPPVTESRSELIRRQSQRQYARPVSEVLDRVAREMET